MTDYNGRYRYNLPILTYNGEFISVENELVVTSDTNSLLNIIDSPSFGGSSFELVDINAFASIDIVQDAFSFAAINADINISNTYIGFSVEKNNNIEFGSLSLTQDSAPVSVNNINILTNSFGIINSNTTTDDTHATLDINAQTDSSGTITNQNTAYENFGSFELDSDLDKSAAADLSITIIPNL
jgi:hypothetical protein